MDHTKIEELKEDVGAELVPELIEAYITETVQRVQDIRHFFEQGDLERTCREAHSLKSSSATFGAVELSKLGENIERRLCLREEAGSIEPVIAQLPEALRLTLLELENYLS